MNRVRNLLKDISIGSAIHFIGLGLSLIVSIALARLLGPTDFGNYVYILSWVAVLGVFGSLGLDRLLVREISYYSFKSDWRALRGIVTWSNTIVVCSASLLAIITILDPHYFYSRINVEETVCYLMCTLVLIYPVFSVQLAALRGLGYVRNSLTLEGIVRPMIMLAMITVYIVASRITLVNALVFHLIATGVITLIAFIETLNLLPRSIFHVKSSFEYSRWFISSGLLLALGCLSVINSNIDSLLLGILSGPKELAVYTAATKGANLVSLPFNILVTTISPLVATFNADGKIADIRRIISTHVRITLIAAIFISSLLCIFSQWFLGLWGKHFTHGSASLVILCTGQLFNVAAGPVACLLIMTQHERAAIQGILLGTLVTCFSGLILIAPLGSNGAAVASSLGLVTWNLFMALSVHRSLGISPFAFLFTDNTDVS